MSSNGLWSWLGDADVNVMSEDGHIVRTHRSVLGLYSSSFRHLLSINPADGGQCMIIFHNVDAMKLEEVVSNAALNFQRFASEEHQDEYDEVKEHLAKLKPVSIDLSPIQSAVKETLAAKKEVYSSSEYLKSAVKETLAAKKEFEPSQDILDSTTRPKNFKADNENMFNEKHNTEKITAIKQDSIKWINIEEFNNYNDKSSEE